MVANSLGRTVRLGRKRGWEKGISLIVSYETPGPSKPSSRLSDLHLQKED